MRFVGGFFWFTGLHWFTLKNKKINKKYFTKVILVYGLHFFFKLFNNDKRYRRFLVYTF